MLRTLLLGSTLSFACGAPSAVAPTTKPPAHEPIPSATQSPESPLPKVPEADLTMSPRTAEVLSWVSPHFRGEKETWVARRGAIRLTPESPVVGIADGLAWPGMDRHVVVDDGTPLRVVLSEYVRLLGYIERGDVATVVSHRARLYGSAQAPDEDSKGAGYVELRPGARVEILEESAARARVRLVSVDPPRSGWVDVSAIGVTFGRDVGPQDGQRRAVQSGLDIVDAPGGRRLTTIPHDAPIDILDREAPRGHQWVHYVDDCTRLAFTGLVRTREIRYPSEPLGLAGGCAGTPSPGYEWGETRRRPMKTVIAGRFFLALDEDVVVGCAPRDVELPDIGDGRVAIPTVWGPIAVRLAPQSYREPCGTVE